MEDHHPLSIPALSVSEDLTRAAGVLQNMQQLQEAQDASAADHLGAPPSLFGAGGPM